MPPSKLLQEVADYCWSKNFLDVFRNFFTEHAEIFEEAPALTGGEHDLKYYNLFNVYLKLYEGTLVSYLKTLKVSIEEFYRDVRDAQAEEPDPYLQTFIDCLLASADYESFYKVMSREGQKSLSRKAAGGKKAPPAAADAKADAKSGAVGAGAGAKGDAPPEDGDKKSESRDYGHK
ncbi:hypothetical protein B484DRAFT_351547 [Ochromonadaceae sp. CCMP2298]|nr:hypothetical protein B484DRAFT_351547 [Ochromonadaceae sp. CCMP2298]|mmetsp:Transcript_10842/g.24021  ORF Transcript_10842/g.24021 Transcript_10842/m.24021 type:complete len:176 (+) Transcript_10842:119-646(+)|eukprot:CAMPEP_0173191476 /NCGR_PEP_ID=MMETSP1141-20130122/12902_1 /TAXON_ID=483371 /ORGANISM="non described non described, Strain CCMP2298" /LENGTH=175 /DNA_ID=CAMNT_0014115661 /DNA_START=67 /DNA_END=594 /DNA_ORIENTATION=+